MYGTLRINNVEYILENQLILINDENIKKEIISNFILTNNHIDKYLYNFNIYGSHFLYKPIFKTNEVIQKFNIYNGYYYGNIITSEIINKKYIDNIKYTLELNNNIIKNLIIVIILVIIIKILYNIYELKIKNNKIYIIYSKFINDNILLIYIIIYILLFSFHFWLLYPGYFVYWDDQYVMFKSIEKNYVNNFPVIIQFTLSVLNNLFGYKSFYVFFINILSWYTGLFLINISLHKKYKSKKILLLLLISFLANIFFMNTTHNKDVTAILIFWLVLSIILFLNTFKIKNKIILFIIYFFISILITISLLWRHTMIVSIYPIFIFFTYLILNNKYKIFNLKYIVSFVLIMLIFAISLIFLYKFTPYLWIKNSKYLLSANVESRPSYHLFMLQIAGISTIANDTNLINKNYYYEGKTFDNLKEVYYSDPINADLYKGSNGIIIKLYEIKNLKLLWIKSIIKHPISYIKHIYNYITKIFTLKTPILDKNKIQEKSDIFGMAYKYDNNGITFNNSKERIYIFLYKYLPEINIIIFIITSMIIFITTLAIIIIKKEYKNKILILSFSTSFSAVSTAIIVGFFTPLPLYRYIYPVIPITIFSLIIFITFLYDYIKNK